MYNIFTIIINYNMYFLTHLTATQKTGRYLHVLSIKQNNLLTNH